MQAKTCTLEAVVVVHLDPILGSWRSSASKVKLPLIYNVLYSIILKIISVGVIVGVQIISEWSETSSWFEVNEFF